MSFRILMVGTLLAAPICSRAALHNPSFEDADRSLMQEEWTYATSEDLLPGWTVPSGVWYFGGQPFPGTVMVYDDAARQLDAEWDHDLVSLLPIAGEVAVGVIPKAFYNIQGQLPPPPYLEQSSLVPVGTRSLWFLWQGERLDLRINGDLVPFSLAEQRLTDDPFVPIHDYYAADISQYAGQEATIRFEFYAHEVHAEVPWPGAVQALDDIYFSPIPEPSPAALLMVGGALLLVSRRRRKHPTRRHAPSRQVGAFREKT